jgi:Cu/Ag efflux pump CusA
MTSATTVLGMMPLVVGRGSGSELYQGLGAAVVGGMTLSTIFTLILVPLLLASLLDAQRWLAVQLVRLPWIGRKSKDEKRRIKSEG